MKLIGLTGGIGTGKSTVSKYLESKGCKIIDADKIAKEMTETDSSTLKNIRDIFGNDIFNIDGTLNRQKLGNIIFSDSNQKKKLEEIITIKVIKTINNEIKYLQKINYKGIVVVDAPLLFEYKMQKEMDESWLIISDMDVRINRIMKRDNFSIDEINNRIKNQMSDSEKIKLATHIIDNSTSLEKLYTQIDFLLKGGF